MRQCFNCQSFGHSSNFCGKLTVSNVTSHIHPKTAQNLLAHPKMYQLWRRPPSQLFRLPQYQQLQHTQRTNSQQRQMRSPKPTLPIFRNQQAQFPTLKTPHPPSICGEHPHRHTRKTSSSFHPSIQFLMVVSLNTVNHEHQRGAIFRARQSSYAPPPFTIIYRATVA